MSQAVRPIPSVTAGSVSEKRKKHIKAAIEGYLYLAPTLIVLAIFVFMPIFSSFNLSLNRIAPFGGKQIFVGIGNYTHLLTDPDYWNSIKVTLLFTLGTVPTGLFLAVLLAIALSYPLKYLTGLHRLLIFVPVVISSAVAGVLFKWLYHPVVGYINYFFMQIGLIDRMQDGPNWLASKQWALVAIIIVTLSPAIWPAVDSAVGAEFLTRTIPAFTYRARSTIGLLWVRTHAIERITYAGSMTLVLCLAYHRIALRALTLLTGIGMSARVAIVTYRSISLRRIRATIGRIAYACLMALVHRGANHRSGSGAYPRLAGIGSRADVIIVTRRSVRLFRV